MWARLAAAYYSTEEIRHSLVHRRAHVDVNGDFVGVDKSGGPLPSLTPIAQEAFLRMVQRVAMAIDSGSLDTRERAAILAELDELASHTRCLPLGRHSRDRQQCS